MLRSSCAGGKTVEVDNETRCESYSMHHGLTDRQIDIVLQGSLLDSTRHRRPAAR